MRNASKHTSLAGVIALVALLGAASGHATVSPPDGAYVPLASQNQSGFGEATVFLPSAYTPPGIVNHAYRWLASQNESGFGEAIVFLPSAYTPPGITGLEVIDVATTR